MIISISTNTRSSLLIRLTRVIPITFTLFALDKSLHISNNIKYQAAIINKVQFRSMRTSSNRDIIRSILPSESLRDSSINDSLLEVLISEGSNRFKHINYDLFVEQYHSLYFPVYDFIQSQLSVKNGITSKPLFIGVSAPQGCGKTTLTDLLCSFFRSQGKHCLSMSLDDFYLTGSEQDELANTNSHNPLLQFRGNAGTHDMNLLMSTMNQLMNHNNLNKSSPVLIPRYDKSARNGRGDRYDLSNWQIIDSPVDIVLFEGWMLGFSPVDFTNPNTTKTSNHIEEINDYLLGYSSLHALFDSWVVLAVPEDDVNVIYRWRLQAEQNMKASGKPSMTDEQVKDFVSRFMPAYYQYLPSLYLNGPERRANTPVLKVTVDMERKPIAADYRQN
eukprot:gene10486-14092_t